ncbi:MAG TPA: hypothetical protein QF764_06805 [Planctomycetota bacterium]|jgi:hypothetical protein|nr:hypothetical protein [Planctomycetota bacterium]
MRRPHWAPLSRAILAALCAVACAGTEVGESRVPEGYSLVYSEDFSEPESLDGLALSDRADWRWSDEGDVPSLELVGGGKYAPQHRSPRHIALIDELLVSDFVLEADLLQTGRQYGHRDLCLFFGFVSPTSYYYCHLAPAPDEHAHNTFLVHDAPRRNLAGVMEAGVEWGEGVWHRVRLERSASKGSISVFFDDMERPTIVASDSTLGWGRVGFGSFDDTGRVARVRIWAPNSRPPAAGSRPFDG